MEISAKRGGGGGGAPHGLHRHSAKPVRVRRTVVSEPAMVGADHGQFEIQRLEYTKAGSDRGKQDRDVDTLAVHVFDPYVRIGPSALIEQLTLHEAPGAFNHALLVV